MKMGYRWRWRWALLAVATTVAAHRRLVDPPNPGIGMRAAAGGEPNSFSPNPTGGVGLGQPGGERAGVRRALARARAVDDSDDAPPPTPPASARVQAASFAMSPPPPGTPEPYIIPIVWAKSHLLVNEFAVVSGTMVMFNWGLAEGHPRDLRLCPTVEAFQQCAVDQCQTLAPVQETGHYIFDTALIGGQPVTEQVTLYFICGVDDHCLDDPTTILPAQKIELIIHPVPEDPCTACEEGGACSACVEGGDCHASGACFALCTPCNFCYDLLLADPNNSVCQPCAPCLACNMCQACESCDCDTCDSDSREPASPPQPVPPQPPVVVPDYGVMNIIWQSNFKGSHVSIVAGTALNFTWEATLGEHSLLRCSSRAFDTCAVEQCELLVPADRRGNILFPTELIDGEPITEEVTLYFICGVDDHCTGRSEAHHFIVTVLPQMENICEVCFGSGSCVPCTNNGVCTEQGACGVCETCEPCYDTLGMDPTNAPCQPCVACLPCATCRSCSLCECDRCWFLETPSNEGCVDGSMHRRQFCEQGMLMSSLNDPSLNPMAGNCANTTVVSVQQDVHGAACTMSNSRLECGAAADAVPHMVYYESLNCTGAQYDFPVNQCTPQMCGPADDTYAIAFVDQWVDPTCMVGCPKPLARASVYEACNEARTLVASGCMHPCMFAPAAERTLTNELLEICNLGPIVASRSRPVVVPLPEESSAGRVLVIGGLASLAACLLTLLEGIL